MTGCQYLLRKSTEKEQIPEEEENIVYAINVSTCHQIGQIVYEQSAY
jgi:hypothetical protein